MKREMSKCECGRIKSKWLAKCNKCTTAELASIHTATAAIVVTGKCPECGSKLRRNHSLAGWYQCEQFGTEQFRARPNQPSCNWQGFTNHPTAYR